MRGMVRLLITPHCQGPTPDQIRGVTALCYRPAPGQEVQAAGNAHPETQPENGGRSPAAAAMGTAKSQWKADEFSPSPM